MGIRKFYSCLLFCCTTTLMAQKDTLRVMSFNILHGATTHNDFNLDTIAGLIKAYQPDLVALQEVDRGTNRAKKYDLPTELGLRTGMASLFARAMYYDGGEYGEAVLSRYSLEGSQRIALAHRPTSEPRAALAVRVRTDQGNVIQFVATHLDHLKEDTDRVMQAEDISKHFKKPEYPTLLVGDLNTQPGSATMQILQKHFVKPEIPEAVAPTYPADGPEKCIDHILWHNNASWEVLDYEVVCENYASDHCVVVATLVYRP